MHRTYGVCLGEMHESANPVNRSIDDLLCPPPLEGGQLCAGCSVLHSMAAVLPPVHAALCNGHISVTKTIAVTSSKVWTIMWCNRRVGSHVIMSRVASMQEQTHG